MERPYLPSEPTYTALPSNARPSLSEFLSDETSSGVVEPSLKVVLGAMQAAIQEVSNAVRSLSFPYV